KRGRPFASSKLFVVSERQVDGPSRLEALREEELDGLELREDTDLVVEGPAPPHRAVGHRAGEGRILPLRLCPRLDGYDVEVTHQQHRRERRVAPLPGVEEAVLVDDLARERVVDEGIQDPQVLVEIEERLRIPLRRIFRGDRRNAERTGKAPGAHGG